MKATLKALNKWLIGLLLVSFAVVIMVFTLINRASSRDAPQLNPNPQYFLTLEGHIAPELQGKVYLTFIEYFLAFNPKCDHISTQMLGKDPQVKMDYYWVKLNKKGYYSVKIPLDKYQPGFCQWDIRSIDFVLTRKKQPSTYINTKPLVLFARNAKKKYTKKSNTMDCITTNTNCQNILQPITLNIQKSWLIQFNVSKDSG